MLSLDKAHAELVMNIDTDIGEAFQAQTLVSQFHNMVNSAVLAIRIHSAAELPPAITRTDSSSTVVKGSSKVSC